MINTLLVGSEGTMPTSSKPAPTSNTNQFARTPAENRPPENTPETTTTDNTSPVAQNEHVNKPPQEFQDALDKETMAQKPQEAQNDPQSKEPTQTPGVAQQPNTEQSWLAANSQNIEHGKNGVATKPQPEAGEQLAQLLANLRNENSPPGNGPTNKPAEDEHLPTATHPGGGKNTGKIQISNQTFTNQESTKNIMPEALNGDSKTTASGEKPAMTDKPTISDGPKTSSLSGKELMPQDLTGGSKTATAGEKPAITDKPAGSQKTSPLSGKELMTETPTTSSKMNTDGENPALADRQAVSGGQKTHVLNDSFPAVQRTSPDNEQKVPVSPEKSAPVAEKPTLNKADNDQQGQTLSELLHGNGKQQPDNPSGDSILHKLNPAETQISTNQTKDHSSSTSNKESNSNFEQIHSSNNAQIPTTEQTVTSANAVKTAGNASPSNVANSISEQIQESIHSSLNRAEQQITIHLNPPELGKVFIKFQEQQNQIIGLLEVSQAQTRVEIQQALPQIIQNLAGSGIHIKHIEVVLANEQEQQASKDPLLAGGQDAWTGQQNAANPSSERNHSDWTGNNEWLINNDSYTGFTQPKEILVTDNSIDMLI